MASGKLEVLLVDAQELEDTRLFGKMHPYVLVQYGDQKIKTKTAKGINPVWNHKLSFDVKHVEGEEEQNKHKLIFTIKDHHKFGCGPCVGVGEALLGEAIIYVKEVVLMGIEKGEAEIQRAKYRVVLSDKTYAGEISVSVKFSLNTQV